MYKLVKLPLTEQYHLFEEINGVRELKASSLNTVGLTSLDKEQIELEIKEKRVNESLLQEFIDKRNTPVRYDEKNKRYNYSEQDIKDIFSEFMNPIELDCEVEMCWYEPNYKRPGHSYFISMDAKENTIYAPALGKNMSLIIKLI